MRGFPTENRQVFRLTTTAWLDLKGSFHVKKSLSPLKRKSVGFQVLHEDVSMIGGLETSVMITNLYTIPDGVYTLEISNASYEYIEGFRTDVLDGYDYKLVPYNK